MVTRIDIKKARICIQCGKIVGKLLTGAEEREFLRSKMCPKCFKVAERIKNLIICKSCGYDMNKDNTLPLKNGDQNAAYHIARLGKKNFNS